MKLIVTNNRKKAEILNEIYKLSKNDPLVSIKELRAKLSFDKGIIDQLLLSMISEGILIPHRSDLTAKSKLRTSKENKEQLYDPKYDVYYIGVTG